MRSFGRFKALFLLTFFKQFRTAGKWVQKWALSLLIRPFLHPFSHRMDIRCFLTCFSGQEDGPSLTVNFFQTKTRQIPNTGMLNFPYQVSKEVLYGEAAGGYSDQNNSGFIDKIF